MENEGRYKYKCERGKNRWRIERNGSVRNENK